MKKIHNDDTNKRIRPVKKRASGIIAALSVFLLLAGCAGNTNPGQFKWLEKYGYLSWSEEVTRDFEAATVLPNYNYYYSGPDEAPFAVIGIDKRYTLFSKFWKPVSPTPEQMKNWLWWMNYDFSQEYGWQPRGYRIIDPKQVQVGVWYSAWDWTVIKQVDDDGLEIYTPFTEDRSSPAFRGDK